MAQQASARRVALVIGNSAYRKARPLPNAVRDAAAVAQSAAARGFKVFGGEASGSAGLDLDHTQIMSRFEAFSREIAPGAIVLLFYAGHGLQVADENYIVPVDADMAAREPLAELVPIRRLIEWAASRAGPTGKVIVLLDACRENPFSPAEMSRLIHAAQTAELGFVALTGGFATMKLQTRADAAPVFVGYATAPGDYAYDGKGDEPHSPFTAAVLSHMETRGLTLEEFAKRVGLDVQKWAAENGLVQDPWKETNLRREFAFNPARSSPVLGLGVLGFLAGVVIALGLFDGTRVRAPFRDGQVQFGDLWVILLGALFGGVVAFGTIKWGSRKPTHAVMAFLGTWVSYALALVIISSRFGRLPSNLEPGRTIDQALHDQVFVAYVGLALLAALLCWIGARLLATPVAETDTFVAGVTRVTEWLIPLFVLVGLVSLGLFLSIGTAQVIASALIWLFAGIVLAAGAALSLKPQGGVFLGFGAATGAIVIGLMVALFFAIATVLAQFSAVIAAAIVLLGGVWYGALGMQLGYCFSFYVPEYAIKSSRARTIAAPGGPTPKSVG
jgi:hypothetical protein